jgi:hypothetical protein
MLGFQLSAPELWNSSCFSTHQFVAHLYIDCVAQRYSPLAIGAIERDTIKFRISQFEKMLKCTCPLHANIFIEVVQSPKLAYYFHQGSEIDDIDEFYQCLNIRALREALNTMPERFPHTWLPVMLFWRYGK